MEQETFKPKMRITLLSDNGTPLSDRLVDSYTELMTGPKLTHKGPIRVEISLTNNLEVENFKTYLDRLIGSLPLKEVTSRGRPSTGSTIEVSSPREEVLGEVTKLVESGSEQKDIIKYLRGLGFVFILTEEFKYHFPDFEFNIRDVGEMTDNKQYLNSLSWMVRRLKEAKDPKTDKYDPQLIFGISIINGPSNKIVPYLYRERQAPLRAKAEKKGLSFSMVGFTKYPPFMREDERLKFSTEIRQMLNNPDKTPSKFFLRWSRDVEIPSNYFEKLKGRGLVFKNFNE